MAGRQSILESLTGHRGTRRSSRVLPIVGSVVLAGGIAVAVYGGVSGNTTLVAGGSVLADGLRLHPGDRRLPRRLGRRLPLTPRIALRDAARNRGRTAPAVAADGGCSAGSVAIATYTSSSAAENDYDHQPNLTAGTAALMTFDTTKKADLPRARAAVDNYPVSGGRTDLGGSGGQRLLGVLRGGERLRDPRHRQAHRKGPLLPLKGKGAKGAALRISADDKRLMNSPACVDESSTMVAFGTDENKIGDRDAALLTSYVKLDDPAAAKALAEDKSLPCSTRRTRRTARSPSRPSTPTTSATRKCAPCTPARPAPPRTG
ncbi:FtsX-like permease family protein OS=Streptomyces microflavus OX=1919 GN=G3I39_34075 PE=4 SV=1 [Streptomyces microflavus]